MDLELLRTFLELHRVRHFGRAAEALHVTQAAVSNRLKLLEQKLGSRLFERNRRKMRLTPEGARLVRHAEGMLAAWNVACQDVSASESQQLVIGGSLRLWDVLLQPWLHELRRANPHMAIIAESLTPDILTRKLLDGTLDVVIVLEPAQLDSLHITPVAKIELICVSSLPDIDIGQALGNGYVLIDWGLSFVLDHRRAFPDAPESRTRLATAKMALQYLQAIGGSAYLPRSMVESSLRSGALHSVGGAPVSNRQAFATYPVRSSRLSFIRSSLELIA